MLRQRMQRQKFLQIIFLGTLQTKKNKEQVIEFKLQDVESRILNSN